MWQKNKAKRLDPLHLLVLISGKRTDSLDDDFDSITISKIGEKKPKRPR
jgi:hypothetical protein